MFKVISRGSFAHNLLERNILYNDSCYLDLRLEKIVNELAGAATQKAKKKPQNKTNKQTNKQKQKNRQNKTKEKERNTLKKH